MDIELLLKVNEKAVDLLGYTKATNVTSNGCVQFIQEGAGKLRGFSIFTNAQDLLDVVNALLKHKIVILQLDDGRFDWVFYETDTYSMNGGGSCDCPDYKTAVAAAVMGVSEDV